MDIQKTVRAVLIATIVIVIVGLGVWYWYLLRQSSSIEQAAAARGFNSATPAFEGGEGSTFENIIEGLGFQNESAVPNSEEKIPRLWRVLATPGAGLGFIAGATSTRLRFLERSTGYLFESDVRTGKTLRLTNTLMPRVYEAAFSGAGVPIIQRLDGERAIVSTVTYAGTSSPEAFGTISDTQLGTIKHFATHPKRQEVLSFVDDGRESVLIRSAWDGSKPSRVFSSSIRDWAITWLEDDTIVLAQAPASGVPGSAFRVENSLLIPLVRSVPGLSVLPRSKSGALLMSSDSGTIALSSRGSAASSTVTLPIRTITEKCVWAPGARAIAYCAVPESITSPEFLDAWYQGRVHTADTWWRVDASTATAEELPSSATMNVSFDVEKPVINDAGEYIAFRNAYDKSVWVLRIAE